MKILAKPIRVIACFFPGKYPIPYKFKIEEEEERIEVKVEQILLVEEQMLAGTESILYTFPSRIHGRAKRLDLKYIKKDCRWELYRA